MNGLKYYLQISLCVGNVYVTDACKKGKTCFSVLNTVAPAVFGLGVIVATSVPKKPRKFFLVVDYVPPVTTSIENAAHDARFSHELTRT